MEAVRGADLEACRRPWVREFRAAEKRGPVIGRLLLAQAYQPAHRLDERSGVIADSIFEHRFDLL